MGSPPHEAIKKILLQSELVKDMKKLSKCASTSSLEIFHALKIRYLPKSIFFEKDKMVAATKVAILDHNINSEREQVINSIVANFLICIDKGKSINLHLIIFTFQKITLKEGKYVPKFKIAFDKRTKKFTASKVKVDKSYNFLREISENAYFRAVGQEKSQKPRLKRKLVAPSDRPDRDQIIEDSTKYSRLKK